MFWRYIFHSLLIFLPVVIHIFFFSKSNIYYFSSNFFNADLKRNLISFSRYSAHKSSLTLKCKICSLTPWIRNGLIHVSNAIWGISKFCCKYSIIFSHFFSITFKMTLLQYKKVKHFYLFILICSMSLFRVIQLFKIVYRL